MAEEPQKHDTALAAMRLRVAEAVTAHLRSIGISEVPADKLAQMVDGASKLLEGLPTGQLLSLAPGDSHLASAVVASFNQVYGQLSENQLLAMKHGVDPTNFLAVQAFLAATLHGGIFANVGAFGANALVQGRANYRAVLEGTADVSAQELAAYSRQYAGLGFNQATIGLFAATALGRATYDAFRKEGYSNDEIVDAAGDGKALGWKGAEAIGDAIHADPGLRDAAVAWAKAKTDEEAAGRERELERVYEGLSPEAKEKSAPFLRRLNSTHQGLRLEIGDDVSRRLVDADLGSGASPESAKLDDAYRAWAEPATKQTTTAAIAEADDVFGAPSTPAKTPTKPIRPSVSPT